MSGHSKWSTIKHKKAATDAARGKLFSKLSKAISIAVKSGGGDNPEFNSKLRVAIDVAKAANMPKANIDRAINKASEQTNLEEIVYEGFGPGGFGILALAATDNRNRTSQDIKGIFDKAGGSLAGPGAVAFNFELRGFLLVEKKEKSEEIMLSLIDLGVEDVEDTDDGIVAYTDPSLLMETKGKVEKNGLKVKVAELVQNPKTLHQIVGADKIKKAIAFLEGLSDHEDIQKVFANADFVDK